VLIVCAGNLPPSILTGGLMNKAARGRFNAFSEGRHPTLGD
jgi:hypothetical protein